MTHNSKSGVAHFAADDEESCLEDVRYLMSFLPQNNLEIPPRMETGDDPDRQDEELDQIVPDNPNKPYDMRDVVHLVVDNGEFFEVQEHFARNIVIGFARLNGRPIGVVGNQPAQLAGVLDISASEKAARFVRFCDAFNVPLLTFMDVPGFLLEKLVGGHVFQVNFSNSVGTTLSQVARGGTSNDDWYLGFNISRKFWR